jgi:hypothetical protein
MTLVLLPGMDGTGRLFTGFRALLDPRFKVTVVSYPSDQPLGYSELEILVRSSLTENRPFVLLAESFSGPLAIPIAASLPSGLAGLVLCFTFSRSPWPWLSKLDWLVYHLPIKRIHLSLLNCFLLGRFSSVPLQSALRGVLEHITHPETGPCMLDLIVGSIASRSGFLRTVPRGSALCLRLVLVQMCQTHLQDSRTGDFHPISSRPCLAYTKG